MALITCKDCKKEFSTDAKRCPNCGAQKPKAGGCAIAALWLVAVLIVIVLMIIVADSGHSPPDHAPRPPTASDARMACREFVKKSLNDPDSAEFDDVDTYPSEDHNDGTFSVQVYLRARNGFNAMRRFSC